MDSENYTKIHVLNRAQIISDASYLMLSHKLDPRIFMDITKYLRRETDYIAWFQMFRSLSEVTPFFLYNAGDELFKVSYDIFYKTSFTIKLFKVNY